jgi:hypothetical protein
MNATNDKRNLAENMLLRGMVAQVSADIEWLLLRIILYCIVDDPSVAVRKFNKMTLGDKISWAKKDLEKYYHDKYKQHEKEFTHLLSFNNLRKLFIHGEIKWDNNQYNSFKIYYLEWQNKKWRLKPTAFTKKEIALKVSEFGNTIISFAKTAKDIIEKVQEKYPDLTNSSNAV